MDTKGCFLLRFCEYGKSPAFPLKVLMQPLLRPMKLKRR